MLLRVARKLLRIGRCIVTLDQELLRTRAEVEELRRTVEASGATGWLYRNRVRRMDATSGVFPESRREFHLDRYRFAASYVQGKAVADVACGTGYGSELLRREGGAVSVVGVDIDPEAVQYACEHHLAEGVRFLAAPGDATGLPAEALDVVVSFETLEHVPDDETLLRELRRILRPGGVLVCSTPNAWPVELSPDHVRTYDLAALRGLLGRYFSRVELFNQNSGDDWFYNHGQPRGIVQTTDANAGLAECYIAVCERAGS